MSIRLPFDPAPDRFLAHRIYGMLDGRCECSSGLPADTYCTQGDKAGKHPIAGVSWYSDDTDSRRQIARWVEARPHSNFGLATGTRVGYFVLDLDNEAAIQFAQSRGLPKTWTVRTGRKPHGLHFYYALPEFPVRNRQGLVLGDGIRADIRGERGYVLAPGSLHESGRRYEWVEGRSPADVPLAAPPLWLVDALFAANARRRELQSPGSEGGGRNDALVQIGSSFLRYRPSREAFMQFIRATNASLTPATGFQEGPLPDAEVETLVHLHSRYREQGAVRFREQVALLRSLLERHRHLLDLSDREFSILVDGLLYVAHEDETLVVRTSARTLFKQTTIPWKTAQSNARRLEDRHGLIEQIGESHPRLGTDYRIRVDALLRAMAEARGLEDEQHTVPLLDHAVPVRLFVSPTPYIPTVLLYVPFRSSLRFLVPLGCSRTLFLALAYTGGATRTELRKLTGWSKAKVNKQLAALRGRSLIETVDGLHRLREDAQDRLQRVWEASSERVAFEHDVAAVTSGQRSFRRPPESVERKADYNPYTDALSRLGPGVHDLQAIIAMLDGDEKDDGPFAVEPGRGLIDTATGEVID